jgi:hypothetical protein
VIKFYKNKECSLDKFSAEKEEKKRLYKEYKEAEAKYVEYGRLFKKRKIEETSLSNEEKTFRNNEMEDRSERTKKLDSLSGLLKKTC